MEEQQKEKKGDQRKKKQLMVLGLVLCIAAMMIAAGALVYYRVTRFSIFGEPTNIFAEEIRLDGREITDLETLKMYLRKYQNLKKVDLGSYQVQAEDSIALRQSFPNTEMVFSTVVTIEGKTYDTNITKLDLSDHGYSDRKQLIRKLDYLPELKTVIFGKNMIPMSEKAILETTYPDISFEVMGTYEIYGKQIPENAEQLDLRNAKLDASLYAQLALLPELRFVDLHDQPLSKTERIALAQEFPDISFGWTVSYGGELYDSSITELDLSGKKLTKEDLEPLKEAVAMLPDLEKLILCDCGLSNETLQSLREELKNIKVVWRIYMGKWSLRTDAVAFSVFIIHYDYRRMTSNDIQVLKYCTDLKALDLGHQAISDLTVIGEYLTDLRLLILADNQIRDVSPLANLTHLHYLELFVNKITDISPLRVLTELVDVNISYNGGLRDIEALLYSPMMEKVWLEYTSVPNSGFALLRETYPDAKIVQFGTGSVDQGWRWNPRYNQMMDMWQKNYYGDEFSKYDELAGHD